MGEEVRKQLTVQFSKQCVFDSHLFHKSEAINNPNSG